MASKKRSIYKKKVFKGITFQSKYRHKRKTSNFIGKESFSGSLKLQRLLFSKSKWQFRNNILIDKRIGENSYDLSEEEKHLDRYSFNLQRKQHESQINLLSKSNNSITIESAISESKADDSTEKLDLFKLKNCSLDAITSYENLPEQISNNGTNILKEVEAQWHVMKYSLLPESRNDIDRYPNSYDVILGNLIIEERTNNYSSNMETDTNNVDLKSCSEFVQYGLIVGDKGVNHDSSKINKTAHSIMDFSDKLTNIQSISEYHILVKEYISSFCFINSNKLMENIFSICDQLIQSLFNNKLFFSHTAQYINHVYSSLYQVLTLYSKFTMKYLIMRVKSMRQFNKLSTNCKMDKHKSMLLLYFLLSLTDIEKPDNYPIVKFGITFAVEILYNCYNQFSSDAGSLILLIEVIMSIGLALKIFVPEVLNFLASFIALYSNSSEKVCFPPFFNSPYNNYHSEFQLGLIEFSPDQIAELSFLSSNFAYDQPKFTSILLQFTLDLLSGFFKTCVEQFSHFGIVVLPLIVNLKLLQKRLDLPICFKNLVHALLEISNIFEERNIKLGLIKGKTKSLKFLDIERSQSSRNVNRVYQNHSKQIHKFTRHHKSYMMRIRKDSSLLSHCYIRQQLFNDQIRNVKVYKLQNNINGDI